MRRTLAVSAISILGLAALGQPAEAETTRTLRGQITVPASGGFAVENLAGSMRVVPGGGDAVVAIATIHAESDEVAGLVAFEQVTDEKGRLALRLRYPLDTYTTFRYPGEGTTTSSWLSLFGGGSNTTTTYAGRRVKVSDARGVLLYADVEVQVPRRPVEGAFRNVVGSLRAEGVEGTLSFDTASGDVKAADLEGSFRGDTGSGDVRVSGFQGEEINCDTGSGDIILHDLRARRVGADTGSGDVRVTAGDVETFEGDTGSGDIELQTAGSRLASVTADTGSGDVVLRLGPEVSFEARASQGSGSIINRYQDAQAILKGKEVVGYRRGDARVRISVETGSGDLTLEPGP